jgi:hypothetical protein
VNGVSTRFTTQQNKMIAIATFATKRYSYAIPNFSRRIVSAIQHAKEKKGYFIFVTDKSEVMKDVVKTFVIDALPSGWIPIVLSLDIDDEEKRNYKNDAQLMIAQMQSYAFTEARKLNVSKLWSVEADVLVPYNALSTSKELLKFDDGYYDVVMCTYPSQGGGSFLGGRGTYQNPIAEDYLPEERSIPEELQKKIEARDAQMEDKNFRPDENWYKERHEIHEEIKKHPPKDNVFKIIGDHGWRKRGWMESAYPALGKGAILPTDWVGMGCTMLSKKALAMAHFDGYQGGGTQDLFLCWNWWNPHGLNMAVCTHVVCDHVVRARGKDNDDEENSQDFNKFIHVQAYHEPEGDYQGHLRQKHNPHYSFVEGEKYVEENDGIIYQPPPEEAKVEVAEVEIVEEPKKGKPKK